MERTDIEQLAKLARIELSDGEKEALRKDTENILAFVGQIQNVNVSMDAEGRLGVPHNVLRLDGEPHETSTHTKELLNAMPEHDRDYLKVQKIL